MDVRDIDIDQVTGSRVSVCLVSESVVNLSVQRTEPYCSSRDWVRKTWEKHTGEIWYG